MIEMINATGRRKSSVARVYLKKGEGKIEVNGKDYKEYFPQIHVQTSITAPLETVEVANIYGSGADGYFPCAGTAERGLPQAPQIAQIPHPGCPRSRAQKIRKTESKKELPVQQALMLPVFFSPSS